MLKNICLIFIFIIYIYVSLGDCGVLITPSPYNGNPQDVSPKDDSSGSKSNKQEIADTKLVNISIEILSPKREDGFFNDSSEIITVLTRITSLSKDGLKIWKHGQFLRLD